MIENFTNITDENAQIAARIDWLIAAGYDFISSESGYSEFTHPNDVDMLEWMEYAAQYATEKGIQMYIKCHCSTGQYCKNYDDPRTGQPLNFNFLPMLANSTLGIYPHTVQFYNFTDPAPTYGNQNFSYMLDFLLYEAPVRPTIYHGETAYWVSYDINVPLFLPQYVKGRADNLRTIARSVNGSYVQGQVVFTSGWEWAYWLNEISNARISWNPRLYIADDMAAVEDLLTEVLGVFNNSQLVSLIMETITLEHQLLIEGQANGFPAPSNVTKLNGIAYLEGFDTWADIFCGISSNAYQPERVDFLSARDPLFVPKYSQYSAMLNQMAQNFTALAQSYQALIAQTPDNLLPFIQEITDAMNMTGLRATQNAALYDYVYLWDTADIVERMNLKNTSLNAIYSAKEVVANREANYRVPVERIASWRDNPTSYPFTYLWEVGSLYWFWRDHDKATIIVPEAASPCYMNIINPVDVVIGDGYDMNATDALYTWLQQFNWTGTINDCLNAPSDEPIYPLHNETEYIIIE